MKAIIVGAGIGGLSAAIALHKVGIETVVYESSREVRAEGAGLGIGANAVQVMDALGLGSDLRQQGKLLNELHIRTEAGKLLQRTKTAALTARFGPFNVTVHRGELLELLLRAVGEQGTEIRTGKTFVRLRQQAGRITASFADGSTDEADLLLAADGIHSAVRKEVLPGALPRYAGYTCWRTVVRPDARELPAEEVGVFTETFGRRGRFGIVPLTDRRIYWYACVNAREADPDWRAATVQRLEERFAGYHAPIPQLLALSRQAPLLHRDILFLPPLKRFVYGRAVLLGDAAHATTPNMGQGAGQALEDAMVLAVQLREHGRGAVDEALAAYDRQRVRRAATITRLSNRIGRIAQLEGRLPAALRDTLMPLVPNRIMEKQLEFLYDVNLGKL